jgi:hypothetical protein
MHRQPSMLGDDRGHLRQLDPLGHADDLGEKIPVQGAAAARAAVGTMLDHHIGVLAHHPAVALVTGLGAAGLGLLAPLLAVCRRRLRRRARGLVRPLQPQHQLNQLLTTQTLKIAATHLTRESAKSPNRKRPGAPLSGRRSPHQSGPVKPRG